MIWFVVWVWQFDCDKVQYSVVDSGLGYQTQDRPTDISFWDLLTYVIGFNRAEPKVKRLSQDIPDCIHWSFIDPQEWGLRLDPVI